MAKVLVVDDAPLVSKMLGDILKKEGFEVCGEADNGNWAVDKYRESKPEVKTCDIVMPKVDDLDGHRRGKECEVDSAGQDYYGSGSAGQHSLVVEAIQAGAKDLCHQVFQPSLGGGEDNWVIIAKACWGCG